VIKKSFTVLFVANSQGTSAGLDGDNIWSNYPHLVQNLMPEIDCRYWMMSELSVKTVSNLSREIIIQHRPDLVVLQLGIIEAGLRILPKSARDILRILPMGENITGFLHKRQAKWRKLLSLMGIQFLDIKRPAFHDLLDDILRTCESFEIPIVVAEIPLLADQGVNGLYPGNNSVITEYNSLVHSVCAARNIKVIDIFEGNIDKSRNSLYLADSVHFSANGHRLAANNIEKCIRNLSSQYVFTRCSNK
jgi:lysophospholipase L1-like esterase